MDLDLTSDNHAGGSAAVLRAIASADGGFARAYGHDDVSSRALHRFRDVFGCDLAVIPVPTGTAANGLALDAVVGRRGVIIGHDDAHIFNKEAGARAFFNDRSRMVRLPSFDGKVPLAAATRAFAEGPSSEPVVFSLTQSTERGTVYTPDEVAALGRAARARGVRMHMDGARFANAVAALGCTPAELSWHAGVDLLSFGATKNGAVSTEAVVVFDPEGANADLVARARQACDWFGYVASKSRFAAAQLDAMLIDGHWLELARHANAMAAMLAEGLSRLPGVRLPLPTETNQVFAVLPAALDAHLAANGARYYPWTHRTPDIAATLAPDERLVRLITSYATPASLVDAFLAHAAVPAVAVLA